MKDNTSLTMLFDGTPPELPDPAHGMTVLVELPPGDAGSPPHRHPLRVIRAGEAFWEPGGDVIHYQAANNLSDTWSRFMVMFCVPGEPMPTYVDDTELAARRDRRAPRPN